jgi:IS30 family transposase
MSQFSISGRVICGQRAAIPSEPSNRQGDLSHTRHPRVIETLRQSRNHPPQQRKEGDLIVGAGSRSAVATVVERTTRYVVLGHLPVERTAEAVRDSLIAAFSEVPSSLRRTLTWDQGAEMSEHRSIAMATNMKVYFCDPASPWQRGTNENTNGLLRQYLPRRSDLRTRSLKELTEIAEELNGRPRKALDWDTPAERMAALLDTT